MFETSYFNDPNVYELVVGDWCPYQPPGDDWEGFGNAVGRNTNLWEITICDMRQERLLSFLPGLALNRSIYKLTIVGMHLSDGEVWVWDNLIPFFNNNQAFECLEVIMNEEDCSYPGPLTSALQSFNTLKELIIVEERTYPVPWSVDSVIEALNGHTGLRKLSCSGDMIGSEGWVALETLLQSPRSNLTTLHLIETRIDADQGVHIILANGLAGNATLKDLEISYQWLTPTDWQPIFDALHRSRFGLEKLKLGDNNMDDAAVLSLLSVLLRHTTTLKTLDLSGNAITDDGLIALTNALSNNLCDSSSILSTYHSNHTLEEVCINSVYRHGINSLEILTQESFLPVNLRSLLYFNRENNKNRVARIKIIKAHFSGIDINLKPFADMETNVLPHAIAWMARDDTVDCDADGMSVMYQFLSTMPLFERILSHYSNSA